VENFDMEEEDEDYEIYKPQMKNIEHEKQIKDHEIDIILIFDLEVINKSENNNCRSEGFGMQKAKDDRLRVSAKSLEIFT
jgi:hypothetical protein